MDLLVNPKNINWFSSKLNWLTCLKERAILSLSIVLTQGVKLTLISPSILNSESFSNVNL